VIIKRLGPKPFDGAGQLFARYARGGFFGDLAENAEVSH
jgi:hypothetical protein